MQPDPAFETRTVAAQFEMRDDSTTGAPILEGYAATFGQPYNMGPFWEQIDRRAFDRTLGMKPDVRLLIDHEGQPLARTKSGTLELRTDDQGLHVRAVLDPSDPDVQRLLPKMRRGDLDEMSFAFRLAGKDGDDWDYGTDRTMRTIREASLAGGDVSVVTYPANPTTTVSLRARDAFEANCVYVEQMVREIRVGRALSSANVTKLRSVLSEIAQADVSIDQAQADLAAVLGIPNPDDDADNESAAQETVEPVAAARSGRPLDVARRIVAALDL